MRSLQILTFGRGDLRGESPRRDQPTFMVQGLKEMCNPRHPSSRLAGMIRWDEVEGWFERDYALDGRPAKPVRLMVSLLILKRLYNLGDGSGAVGSESLHAVFFRGDGVSVGVAV